MTSDLTLDQVFTVIELNRALALYRECQRDTGKRFNTLCAEEIVSPVLDRINQTTGQENDANYLAYAIEFALIKGGA
jgi:hypothetical protein